MRTGICTFVMYCVYKSKRKFHLRTHILHKHTDEYNFPCSMCDKKYKIKQTFQKFHIRTKHKEQEMSCDMLTHKNNICTISKKTFAKKSNLTRHQVIHQRVQVDNRYKFNYCGKSFKEKANFTRHIRIKHQKQQPINCDVCNKIFFS